MRDLFRPAAGAVPIAVLGTVLDWWNSQPSLGRFLFGTAVALAGFAIGGRIWTILPPRSRKRRDIEFYGTRNEKNRVRGNLPDEIQGAEEVWLAFEKGNYFTGLAKAGDLPITRIITLDPYDEVTMRLSKAAVGDEYDWASVISDAHVHAKRCGIQIRGVPGPIFNAVIADPHRIGGWARVHTFLPGLVAEDWPSTVIYRQDNEEVFNNLVRAYEYLWDHPDRMFIHVERHTPGE